MVPALHVTYADGSTEVVPSDMTPEGFFESRFGGLEQEVKDKCQVVQHLWEEVVEKVEEVIKEVEGE